MNGNCYFGLDYVLPGCCAQLFSPGAWAAPMCCVNLYPSAAPSLRNWHVGSVAAAVDGRSPRIVGISDKCGSAPRDVGPGPAAKPCSPRQRIRPSPFSQPRAPSRMEPEGKRTSRPRDPDLCALANNREAELHSLHHRHRQRRVSRGPRGKGRVGGGLARDWPLHWCTSTDKAVEVADPQWMPYAAAGEQI